MVNDMGKDETIDIGRNIKNNRLSAGLTQTQLAQRVGVTHAAISYWENDINVPDIADCIRIADVLDIYFSR